MAASFRWNWIGQIRVMNRMRRRRKERVCISLSILISPGSRDQNQSAGGNRRVGNESKCIRRAVMISKRRAGYLVVEGVFGSCLFFHLKEHSSRILQTQRHEKSISQDSLLTSSCSRIQICMRTVPLLHSRQSNKGSVHEYRLLRARSSVDM